MEPRQLGPPTWQSGVAVLYTDESHGYGNTGVDNPPAQTNATPNLHDAAFTAAPGRDEFDACTHVDNDSTPAGPWRLPEGVRLNVTAISADAATVQVDVAPDCSQ